MSNTSKNVSLTDPEPVAGPSTNIVEAYPVVLTPGGSIVADPNVVSEYEVTPPGQLRTWRPDLVFEDSSEDDAPVVRKKPKKSSKRLDNALDSKKLADRDIEDSIDFPDSGSEEEEEEAVEFGNTILDHIVVEESKPIDHYYPLLQVIKLSERNRWVSMDEMEKDEGAPGQLMEVDVQLERIVDSRSVDDWSACVQAILGDIDTDEEIVVEEQRDENVLNLPPQQVEDISIHPSDSSESVFDWKDDYESFTAQMETYERIPGPKIKSTCPYELFTAFWDHSIVNLIVEQTNKYAWDRISAMSENEEISAKSRLLAWQETNKDEIYVFFSILIYMTLCYRPRMEEYWTTGILGMSGFRSLMSRDRFFILLRFIHFVDNDISTHTLSSYDKKVHKIAPIINHCNDKFQELYVPKQHLSLDESLLLWKGRLSWVQCIRSKAARFGIKSFDLCEGDTGFLLKTILYAGKDSSGMQDSTCGFQNSTAKIVLKVSEGYLDVGHVLVMDSWYNQLSLTRYLKSRRTDVLGTLNRRQKNVPDSIRSLSERNIPKGQIVARHCGDVSLVAWNDVRLVTMVSTYHKNETYRGKRGRQVIDKPVAVGDYTKYMGGVDRKDQRLSMYPTERKRGTKWYMKVFRRMLNTTLMNAFLMYKANHTEQGLDRQMTHRQFRCAVAELLYQRHNETEIRARIPTGPNFISPLVHRLDKGTHVLVRTERGPAAKDNARRLMRRRCKRCSAEKRMQLVSTMCNRCNVGLCVGRCFEEYHTLPNLGPPVKK